MTPGLWFNNSHSFLDLFSDTLRNFERMSNSSASRGFEYWAPYFDVKETEDAYKLEGELPGVQQKDISIEFADNNTLTIRGHTENVNEEGKNVDGRNIDDALDTDAKTKLDQNGVTKENNELSTTEQNRKSQADQANRSTYWVRERSVGDFQRSFSFPNNIDQEHVKACLQNGVLSVNIPKMAPTKRKPRKIEVE